VLKELDYDVSSFDTSIELPDEFLATIGIEKKVLL